MQDAMILNKQHRQEFTDFIYDFIRGNTEYEVCCLHESATDSEHVHRVSVFVCDKDHNPKDLRYIDELNLGIFC
jgi:hypothetical protein